MKTLTSFITLLPLLLSQTGFATESRISLTASDGTGLELHKLEARVVLDGFLAFTELKMVFYNPQNRQREGRFQIILPDNAAISRFAMKIADRLQEGEVVEKQLARRAYEDFLHRRQDPALLETDSGNRFNARIFPIAPQSEKLLILSYSQRLLGENSEYVLPLKGLPQLKQLSIQLFYDNDSFSTTQLGELTGSLSKREILTIDKRDYQPTVDLRMPYQPQLPPFEKGKFGGIVMQSEQIVAARIIPFTDTGNQESKQSFDNLILLMDTSASQAPYLSDSLKRLQTLLPLLQIGTLRLYTYDQEVQEIGTADNLSAQSALIDQVQQHQALGASRLDSAIAALKALKLKKARLLLISDAVITAGETSAAQLAAQLKTVDGLERVDVLIPSYHSDKQIARHLAKAGQTPGIVASLTLSDAQIKRKLTSPVYADIPISVSGSNWYWPEKVEALQTNEPLIIFAERQIASNQSKGVNISIGDKNFPISKMPPHASKSKGISLLLKREWVQARIDKLLALEDNSSDPDQKNAFHNEIINLSVKERVLSPYTSLLVLETEDDYRRYNIERKGLADILTIGLEGITVMKRAGVETEQPISVPIPEEAVATPKADENEITESSLQEIREKISLLSESEPDHSVEIEIEKDERESAGDASIEGLTVADATGIILFASDTSPIESVELRARSAPLARSAATHLQEQVTMDLVDYSYSDGTLLYGMAGEMDVEDLEGSLSTDDQAEETATFVDSTASMARVIEPLSIEMSEEPSVDNTSEASQETTRHDRRFQRQMRRDEEVPAGMRSVRTPFGERFVPDSDDTPRSEEEAEEWVDLQIQPISPPTAESTPVVELVLPRVKKQLISPWIGRYAEFRTLLDQGDIQAAGKLAQNWHQDNLSDVMALIALGEWYDKTGDSRQAARAYGSLIDYFPARADIRRWAAERLLSLKTETWLSLDSLKKAVKQRPDHPSGHYLLALAYWEVGQYQQAVATLQAALERNYPRFQAVSTILTETLALMLTQLAQQQQLNTLFPGNTFNWEKATQSQLRFVLFWETDANDVDFHIYDNQQHHAFYSQRTLPTGGTLYADITTGYGPECFTISEAKAFPYQMQAHYYNMGPMGYGMGVLHLLDYKAKTGIISEWRPFVVMTNDAFVELGRIVQP
ncbi:MAG TPA: tetratricopeptide repeat protein [Thiotrichaceae bacterium]|nr:tetratricopeptide repeat protein [Thiotrichaceae bacterium]